MKKKYASNKGKFSSVFTTIVTQNSSKVLRNGQLEKCSTNPKSVNATQPNSPPSRRVVTARIILSFGAGVIALSGYAIWSFNRTNCDGTVNFKANANQGVEFAYSKTNCYPAQSQQAKK